MKISDYKYDALNKKLLGISDSVELNTESDIKRKVNLKQASCKRTHGLII